MNLDKTSRLASLLPNHSPSDIECILTVFAMKIDLKNPNEISEAVHLTEETIIEILFNREYRDTIIDARVFDAISSHDLQQLIHLYNEFNGLSEKHNCGIEKLLLTICPFLQEQKGEL